MRKKLEEQDGKGKTILLHSCCGPCSTSSIERLLEMNWKIVLYYQNDNIFPENEWEKRYNELLKVATFYDLKVVGHENYNHQAWRKAIEGFEDCPEHGLRCAKCFAYNLSLADAKAKELKIDFFTTTLTVSRFKNSQQIFSIGKDYPPFMDIDFKKKDGFSKSVRLSNQLGLYRQQYCGCEFSFKEKI
ncbi:MAG: epoxyqueuosine reductase QueH [Sphaerochaetaceae bacterium]|nr:epoxyqueuosine reductase QueH [Sphaerochaetaceae bacterium]